MLPFFHVFSADVITQWELYLSKDINLIANEIDKLSTIDNIPPPSSDSKASVAQYIAAYFIYLCAQQAKITLGLFDDIQPFSKLLEAWKRFCTAVETKGRLLTAYHEHDENSVIIDLLFPSDDIEDEFNVSIQNKISEVNESLRQLLLSLGL